jgi:glycosyltransferase involved in cell wall biosynthesis
MILHVYTMTHNEEYMIEYFLRHYTTVADRIFVIDDASTDRTREIVAACPIAEIIDYPYPSGLMEKYKAMSFSKIYRHLSRGVADWVICVDCDEFIYHPRLREVLAEQRALGVQGIRPRGVVLGAEQTPHTDGQLYDACPLGFATHRYSKPVIFDPAVDIWFYSGQHQAKTAAPMVEGTGIDLFHCCYLSREWIRDHMRIRWARMPPEEVARFGGITQAHATEKALWRYKKMIREGVWKR